MVKLVCQIVNVTAFCRFSLTGNDRARWLVEGSPVGGWTWDKLPSMSSPGDQLDFSFRPPERRVWTVQGLVAAVRSHIEREYSDAWVEGEISNFRAPDSGHLYFTLKDGNAQIRVVMFSSKARLLRFRPADGMQVVVRGRITIYEDRGELQIAAEYIEPKGAGGLQVAFEQLKAKLEAEGLFAAERKKAKATS